MAMERNARGAIPLFSAFQAYVELGDVRTLGPADHAEYERYLALAREQLDETTFNTAWEEGRKMTLEQMIATAEQEIANPLSTAAPVLPRDPNALTPRELEVLRLVAAGLSDAQVAAQLVINRRTVSTHLTAIYNKLGVSSRVAATRCALDHSLI